MKYFILILIIFSLKTFSHEIENHPEYLTNSCNFYESLFTPPAPDDFEESFHHYLDQDCDFSVIEYPFIPNDRTRMEKVIASISRRLYISVLKRLIDEFHMDMSTPILYSDNKPSPLYLAIEGFHWNEANYPYRKKDHKEAFEFIEFMLKAGADVNWKGSAYEGTILIHAIKSSGYRNTTLINLLIKYGARLDVEDSDGLTAKDYLGFAPSTEYDPNWQSVIFTFIGSDIKVRDDL